MRIPGFTAEKAMAAGSSSASSLARRWVVHLNAGVYPAVADLQGECISR